MLVVRMLGEMAAYLVNAPGGFDWAFYTGRVHLQFCSFDQLDWCKTVQLGSRRSILEAGRLSLCEFGKFSSSWEFQEPNSFILERLEFFFSYCDVKRFSILRRDKIGLIMIFCKVQFVFLCQFAFLHIMGKRALRARAI